MPDVLDAPKQAFEADLARISELLDLVAEMRQFGGVDVPDMQGQGVFDIASRALRERLRTNAADLPVMSGTLLLYVAGRFEHFAKTSFQASCDEVAAKCKRYDQLPKPMQENLRLLTAECAQNPQRYGRTVADALTYIQQLASNIQANDGLGSVNSTCLANTQNNMTARMLSDLYGRIGLKDVWVEIGKQSPMKSHFELTNDGDVERKGKARLDEMMTMRNQVAHPDAAPVFPDVDQVRGFLRFVLVLASVVTDVSRAYITAFRPSTVV